MIDIVLSPAIVTALTAIGATPSVASVAVAVTTVAALISFNVPAV